MNILDQSIEAAGGVSALAKALSINPTVISNWKARGIPDSWATALVLMKKHRDGVFMRHATNVMSGENSIGAATHKSR